MAETGEISMNYTGIPASEVFLTAFYGSPYRKFISATIIPDYSGQVFGTMTGISPLQTPPI
jgi:hypothetical protein